MRITGLCLGAILIGMSTAGAQPPAAPEQPTPITVSNRGGSVEATRGSYCLQLEQASSGAEWVSTCADAAYPLLVNRRLPVAPRQTLEIDTQVRARRIDAGLVRLRGRGPLRTRIPVHVKSLDPVRRANSNSTRWRITLPRDLRRATVLDVDVVYSNGDANFWAGIRSKLAMAVGSR